MIILDTSVWIEFLKNNQVYFNSISQMLTRMDIMAVEVVFGELLQGVKNKREETIIFDYWEHLPKIDDNTDIIISAGKYSHENKLIDNGVGLIDSIILMHGIKTDSKIWTLDTKFLKVIPPQLIYTPII
ncbi:hypothetical protein FACS1894142_7170 [Spirochaetia bacterium]|nr:hypothetical protein FACS1894142_7170 [Spirochaetia bacterium]GHU58396.1 hypothetical protein FACS189444_1990 [Spirochaetia bacterium]